jgi:hypothetical protein
VGNDFCDFGAAVRPYKVNCPEGGLPCPDVFTMDPSTRDPGVLKPQLMSFRLGSPGLSVEVASAIGEDGSQDPGICLSLHSDPEALAKALCDGKVCNVSVTAYDNDVDGENDEWDVEAIGVTALMCHRRTGTVLGKATLTFGFKAINKELDLF